MARRKRWYASPRLSWPPRPPSTPSTTRASPPDASRASVGKQARNFSRGWAKIAEDLRVENASSRANASSFAEALEVLVIVGVHIYAYDRTLGGYSTEGPLFAAARQTSRFRHARV